MMKHYDNREAAEADLRSHGWVQQRNGRWVSDDGECAAQIHPTVNSPKVAVAAWEIVRNH